ncbi:MAG: hypothetical protein ACYTJ0_00725 [Planctomycetota bacterium]|jgi:hypothetical protein
MHARASIVMALILLAGCTSVRESFPGCDRDEVWASMVAVARSPGYDDPDPSRRWVVRTNDVWVDDAGQRIELQRLLVRQRSGPDVRPRREERRLRLRITLDPQSAAPTARLTSLEGAVAAHTWEEGVRYFSEVWSELRSR